MKAEQETIQRVLNGDVTAYDEIINCYQKPVYKFVCNSIKDEDAAKDITQEVFITAYYKLYTYNSKYKFTTWLFQIAVNKSIDYMRKNKKRQEVDICDIEVIDKRMSPEAVIECRETKQTLEAFIRTLSKSEQQIISLRYAYEELTFRDISEILKMNESTVKYKYYKVYEKFEKYCNKQKGVMSCYEMY